MSQEAIIGYKIRTNTWSVIHVWGISEQKEVTYAPAQALLETDGDTTGPAMVVNVGDKEKKLWRNRNFYIIRKCSSHIHVEIAGQ